MKTIKSVLNELKLIEKYNTDPTLGTLDYDGFAEKVLQYMEKLSKYVKEERMNKQRNERRNMNHKQKKTLARKMQTNEELKEKGKGIFETKAWESRKEAIADRVEGRERDGRS